MLRWAKNAEMNKIWAICIVYAPILILSQKYPWVVYHILSYHRTYPYKCKIKQFHSLQITANVLFVYLYIKTYVVGTHLNCINLLMQFKWVPTTWENQKKNKKTKKKHRKFKELLPVLSSRHLSFKTCGRVYSSCVQSTMRHASETWPLTKPNLQPLQRNDGQWSDRPAMSSSKTLSPSAWHWKTWTSSWRKEGSAGMETWNTPTVQSSQPVTYSVMEKVSLGGPRWHVSSRQRICREWKLSAIDPHDRHTWRSGVRSAIHAASTTWKGAGHWCGCCPSTCRLIEIRGWWWWW